MANIPSFIFGGNTKYKTQEELEAAREAVRAMLGDIGHSGLTGWGSFMADIGKGIGARIDQGRIDRGQEELLERQAPFSQTLAELAGGYGGGGGDDTLTGGGGPDSLAGGGAQDEFFSKGGGGDPMALASSLLGKREIPDRATIKEFMKNGGVNLDPATTAWCAAFVNSTLAQSGIKGTGSNMARSFLNYGTETKKPKKGDIAVFRRGDPSGPYGHVGFFDRVNPDGTIRVLGGNQGDAVSYSNQNPAALLSYRAIGDQLSGGGGASGQAGGGAGDSFLQAQPNPDRFAPQIQPAPPAPAPAPTPVPPPQQAPQPFDLAGRRRMTPAMTGIDFLHPPGDSLAGTETAPRIATAPVPPAPVPPAPAPVPTPTPPTPAPVTKVDPFTDMILGDQASKFRPGGYIPPAPVGKQVFPAAPPAPGTPAAAGFGVPPVVGGGGADQLAGKGTFPPAPAPPQAQAGGGGPQNVIGKLMFIIGNPYASDEQKRMATAMLQREYALEDERRKAASPEAQLEIQYKKAQIANLTDKGKDATPMTPEERQRWGIPADDPRPWMLVDGKPELVGGAQAPGGGGDEEKFFGNPILINKPGGGTAYGIYGDRGTFKEIQLPEGTTVAPSTKNIDVGTETLVVDQAGNVIARMPKQLREAEKEKAAGAAAGKTEGEVAADLSSITSKMPGVRETVGELGKLADAATYTRAGQLWDTIREETGAEPREASIARTKYNSVLNNQILPLLKETFGPQFTDAEGLRLQATLGDPDVAPAKKHAALEAFLAQKEKDIAALQTRAGKQPAAPAGGSGSGTPPEGVSQRAWNKMTPEQRALWP